MSSLPENGVLVLTRSRAVDFYSLTKPELTFLSVLTALAGAYLATNDLTSGTFLLAHVMVGTMLVGGGAGALNQFIERRFDSMMKRTENRPIPSGRISSLEALLFGMLLSASGVCYLFATTNLLTTALGLVTLLSYLFLYTPLKRLTWLSTIVGGIPGALPPVMGWTAVKGDVSLEALVLFGILFFWQMPHFFSLAWMYRKDYDRAGFPMLPVLDADGKRTSVQIVGHTVCLLAASLLLTQVSGLGPLYLVGSSIIGCGFLACGVVLAARRDTASARRVFFASLVYLPLLLAIVVVDRLVGS